METKEQQSVFGPESDILLMEMVFRLTALERIVLEKKLCTEVELAEMVKQLMDQWKKQVEERGAEV